MWHRSRASRGPCDGERHSQWPQAPARLERCWKWDVGWRMLNCGRGSAGETPAWRQALARSAFASGVARGRWGGAPLHSEQSRRARAQPARITRRYAPPALHAALRMQMVDGSHKRRVLSDPDSADLHPINRADVPKFVSRSTELCMSQPAADPEVGECW